MKWILRFLRLPKVDRCLVVRALFWVVTVRLGLAVLPFRSVERGLCRIRIRGLRRAPVIGPSTDRIVWAVDRTADRVPGARCLARALACQVLLARFGRSSRLRIGVRRRDAGTGLDAHAWLEEDGRVIFGATAPDGEFQALSEFDEGPR